HRACHPVPSSDGKVSHPERVWCVYKKLHAMTLVNRIWGSQIFPRAKIPCPGRNFSNSSEKMG
ncbi:hypothetical protein, partial [Desulfobacula sp.]|uniref:hypothetical protein n=1 Tax=Desulfobacula sp. TaxID=2593537 RepID=UPI0039B8DD3A